MVVLVIIGVLAALIVPNVLDRADDARVTAARTDVNNLMQALKLYKLDNQRYPSAEQGLEALVAQAHAPAPIPPNWKPYVDKLPADPWGRPYQYLNPGVKGEIDVFSFGADGAAGRRRQQCRHRLLAVAGTAAARERRSSRARGFTLIELLVVVAIVAAVAGRGRAWRCATRAATRLENEGARLAALLEIGARRSPRAGGLGGAVVAAGDARRSGEAPRFPLRRPAATLRSCPRAGSTPRVSAQVVGAHRRWCWGPSAILPRAAHRAAPGRPAAGAGHRRPGPLRGGCPRRRRHDACGAARGFTLIEVLVALAIVAITLGAGLRAAGALTDNAAAPGRRHRGAVVRRQPAHRRCAWRASSRASATPTSLRAARPQLRAAQLVTRPTPNPNFRRVDAVVSDEDGQPLLTLSTVLSRY